MASQLASLESEKKEYQSQLDIVESQLKDNRGNAELQSLQAELTDIITLLNESIAELKPKQAPKPAAQEAAPPPPPAEKWSRENHPAFKKAAPAAVEEKEDPAPVSYQVNDTVLAKWLSGDKAFYPARITSITGSSTAPFYTVKFKSYDTTETLRAKDIRPVSNKRKADGTPASSSASSTAAPQPAPAAQASTSNGVVTSAAASLYPEQQAKMEAERAAGDAAAKPKAKKIKANKELEAGKSKWQDFNSKSKFGKASKKDSMFRTPDGIHGRVGFTGSGQAMRKDPTRSRHIYQQNEEMD